MKTKTKSIRLSPSKISLFNDCPRCFYDAEHGIKRRPRGIFPSLPGGIDRVLKTYFDVYRQAGAMPPEVDNDILIGLHLFEDQAHLNRWRNWRTGLTVAFEAELEGVTLIGAIDDLLYDPATNKYSPFDYKTKGSRPKDNGSQYYQTQLDCYALMLGMNGYTPSGKAYLCYVWPETVNNSAETFEISRAMPFSFGVQTFQISADPKRAHKLIYDAVSLLSGERPERSADCEYCQYLS